MDDVEVVTRYIAARKMGLIKDPRGIGLPITLWSRYDNQAIRLLELHSREEVMRIVEITVHPT